MEMTELPTVLCQICLEFGVLLTAVLAQDSRIKKQAAARLEK